MIERDENGVAHIVGLSGGKDSTALALMLAEREPRPYTYVCTPTGDELPEMVQHWLTLEKLLGKPLMMLQGPTLSEVIEREKMIPNFNARFCTRMIKLAPYGKFIKTVTPAVSYIGLRDDEDGREGAAHGGDFVPTGTDLIQRYPLREWGLDIDDVWDYLNQRGIKIPERTDCARCYYQKLGEWYNLWHQHPAIYADAEAMEARHGHTFRSAQRDTWPADLKGLRERFEQGHIPERSLKMMEKRKGMCRACTL